MKTENIKNEEVKNQEEEENIKIPEPVNEDDQGGNIEPQLEININNQNQNNDNNEEEKEEDENDVPIQFRKKLLSTEAHKKYGNRLREDYKYVITAPNKMHLETVITFDELATEPVELVLKSYGSGSMGLYKTDYLYLDAIDSHFDIKDTTGALSSGEGDKINYNMSDINACLLFTAEVSLNEERTEMVFNTGTVEIKSLDELE